MQCGLGLQPNLKNEVGIIEDNTVRLQIDYKLGMSKKVLLEPYQEDTLMIYIQGVLLSGNHIYENKATNEIEITKNIPTECEIIIIYTKK